MSSRDTVTLACDPRLPAVFAAQLAARWPLGSFTFAHMFATRSVLGLGLGLVGTFLPPGTTRHSSLMLYFPASALESATSLRSLGSF